MITNLIAIVLVSVVTNWTEQYEYTFQDNYAIYEYPAQRFDGWKFETIVPKGKYIGKDGIVVRVTEIKFDYNGKPQVHRIEEPLEKIIMRCHEKKPEMIWDEPIREQIKPNLKNLNLNVTGAAVMDIVGEKI